MPSKVKIIQGNTMNRSHLLWPILPFGYLSGLYTKVLMMKLRLCLPELDFCLSSTSAKVRTGLSKGQWNPLLNKIETKAKSPSQIEFFCLTAFKIGLLDYGSLRIYAIVQ